MFLIIGYCDESTIKHFLQCLENEDWTSDYDFIDLCAIEGAGKIDIEFKEDLLLTIDGKRFDFTCYQNIYSRCFTRQNCGDGNFTSTQKIIQLINNYLEDCDKQVINKPSAGFSNYSKLFHAQKLKDFGFIVPDTWIFGTASVARKILSADGEWITKGISSVRTRAAEFDFSHYANLDLLEAAPSLFQRKATGFDVRLHLIGCECVALKITSDDIDYRYNQGENHYEEIEVPSEILEKCVAYCQSEELIFAGIDFKVNTKGEWQMLEVNPMPGYNYFDKKVDRKISKMLCRFLTNNKKTNEHQYQHYTTNRPFIPKNRRKMS